MKKSVLIGIIVAVVVIVGIVLGIILIPFACKHDDPTKIIIVDAVVPTCQETGLTKGKKCTLCGTMVVPQAVVGTIECIESDWIIDEEATHTEDGKRHTECTMCGTLFKEEILLAGYKKMKYTLLDNGTYEVSGIGNCKDKEIVIPSEYNGKAVTSIGDSAFYNRTSLTSIEIPDSVTSIGDNAFYNCTSLQYNQYDNGLYLGNESNPYIILITAASEDITSCEIHGDTKFIHTYAFYECTSLTSINIPESVTSIGHCAFCMCTSLTSIVIPDSVTSIGDDAFYGCTSLTSIVIPDSVTSIGGGAFYECTSLTSINIPNSVTSIVEWAFSHCTSLTSVTIPDSVTSIGDYAFCWCTSLQYNQYDNGLYLGNENNPYIILVKAKNENITSCEIHGDTKFIHTYAFYECTSLTSINIPESVTSIGHCAFRYCTSLTSINFSGTKAQWDAIEKVYNWDWDTGNYTIYCTDGNISK